MPEPQTKKVRQTTVEEYVKPIEETKQQVIEVKPIEQSKVVEPEIDYDAELKIAISNNDLSYAKFLLDALCESPIEKAIRFLQYLPDGTQATIIIERLADSVNQKNSFVCPCNVQMKLCTYTWYSDSSTDEDLQKWLVDTYGGGNYRFEIRYNKGFTGISWKETFADSPEWIAKVKIANDTSELEELKKKFEQLQTEKQNVVQTQQNSNSSELLELRLEIQKANSKSELEMEKLKHQFELDKLKAENKQSPLAETPIALLQLAAKSDNKELVTVAKDLILDNKKTFADFALETLDNPERLDAITNLVGNIGARVFSLLIPGATTQTTQTQPQTSKKNKVNPNTVKKESYEEMYARMKADKKKDTSSETTEKKNSKKNA